MKKKATDLALEYIEQKIVSRAWKPGDKISSEKELEEEIGVSRSSIRSAVEKLVALNVLAKRPGDGTYVNSIDSDSMLNTFLPLIAFSETSYYEILQCRMKLDILAIELFIDNMTPEQLEKLRDLHLAMHKTTNNVEEFMRLDMKFHHTIAEGGGNKTLMLISDILFSILKEFSREQYVAIPLQEKCRHHERLFKAIEAKNKRLATSYEEASFLENMEAIKNN